MAVTVTDQVLISVTAEPQPQTNNLSANTKMSFVLGKIAGQKYLPQENYFSSKTQTGRERTIQQAISIISQQPDTYYQYYDAKKMLNPPMIETVAILTM
jgi:hypothetical protein